MNDARHPKYLLYNGSLVEYAHARVHVLSAAFKYGAIAFEGLRVYRCGTTGELLGFRFREHFERLIQTCTILRLRPPLAVEGFIEALVGLIRTNELADDLHCRVQVFLETDDGGMASTDPVSYSMAAMPAKPMFARAASVAVSSWARIADRSMPPRSKVVANYVNSRLALMQARQDGYDDAVMLTGDGKVAEGPGYNLFLVRRGRLVTPPVTDSILEGITRASVIEIARDLGIPCDERSTDRSELYLADELFFCGSAAEISPISTVDGHGVRSDVPGPITQQIHRRFLEIARGADETHREWLTPIT